MGACQSHLCQCNEEDTVLQSTTPSTAKNRQLTVSTSNHHKGNAKLKNDMFSPTFTEATSPGSTYITSSSGPLSLTSVISVTSTTLNTTTSSGSTDRSRRKSKFRFNTPSGPNEKASIITEERDPDSASDLEVLDQVDDEVAEKNPLETAAASASPKEFILNPPLVAPPRGQATVLLQAAKTQESVNGRMIRDFNKIRDQTSLASRKEKKTKKEAKIEDRMKDIKGYSSLWEEYQEIQKLCTTEAEKTEGAKPKATNSTASFVVNVRKEMKMGGDDHDDGRSRHSGLSFSFLSSESLEAQKALYSEKRQTRVARYLAAKKATNEKNTKPSNSEAGRRQISYFQARMEENAACFSNPCFSDAHSSPQMSPPRLEVSTNGTITTLGRKYEYELPPSIQDSELESVTDMEVFVEGDKRKDDETSAITDADFEHDYWRGRRARAKSSRNKDDESLGSSRVSYRVRQKSSKNKDDESLGSSLISYRDRPKSNRNKGDESLGSSLVSYGGELPGSIKSIHGLDTDREAPPQNRKQDLRPESEMQHKLPRSQRKNTMSKGIAELAEMFDRDSSHNGVQKQESLGDRISDLEKKMGMVPTEKSTLRVVGLKERSAIVDPSPIADLKNPIVVDHAAPVPAGELAPTKLEATFDQSSDIRSSDIRENIVLRNCARSKSSVACMNKKRSQRISDDHAMVQVSKRFDDDSCDFVVRESANASCDVSGYQDSPRGMRNTSFANDVADEIGLVLSKYRNESLLDAQQAMAAEVDNSFTNAQGKLYCA